MEANGSTRLSSDSNIEAVIRAFEKFGVIVIKDERRYGSRRSLEVYWSRRIADWPFGK
jgi:hypothetical protein